MKKYLLSISLIIPIALSACGTSREDGFSDEEEKSLAWSAYKCGSYMDVSARSERMSILIDIMGDNIPMDEVPEAQRWERRLERADTVGDAMEYKDVDGISGMCAGWLWERHTEAKSYMMNYDDFTAQDAVDAGAMLEK